MRRRNLISKEELLARAGLSEGAIYRAINRDGFPKPVHIGKCSYWVSQDVDAWFRERTEAGLRMPKPRRKSGKHAKTAAPKPRIFREGASWCIKASANLVFRSDAPANVYKLWQQWGAAA